MMKIAYFDCFSGISGDMCLGALVSAGVDFDLLSQTLNRLPITGYQIRQEKIKVQGIAATNIHVDLLEEKQPSRNLKDLMDIIQHSELPLEVKEKSEAVFQHLARAEAQVHGTTVEKIHFHEVGAIDAIVDIIGTIAGLHFLHIDALYASPLPMSNGFIHCQHGILPSPAPATLELLRHAPIYGTNIQQEMVTPTGAAILTALTPNFTPFPAMYLENIGYGAGKTKLPHPNLLRILVGESLSIAHHKDTSCSQSPKSSENHQ